jgi:hypothetical protein
VLLYRFSPPRAHLVTRPRALFATVATEYGETTKPRPVLYIAFDKSRNRSIRLIPLLSLRLGCFPPSAIADAIGPQNPAEMTMFAGCAFRNSHFSSNNGGVCPTERPPNVGIAGRILANREHRLHGVLPLVSCERGRERAPAVPLRLGLLGPRYVQHRCTGARRRSTRTTAEGPCGEAATSTLCQGHRLCRHIAPGKR